MKTVVATSMGTFKIHMERQLWINFITDLWKLGLPFDVVASNWHISFKVHSLHVGIKL